MCQSQAEGGKRCAAATRPAYAAAIQKIQSAASLRDLVHEQAIHMDTVVAHAATRSGAVEVAALIDISSKKGGRLGDYLTACLSTATALNEKQAAVEAAVADSSVPATRSGSVTNGRCKRPPKVYHVVTDISWQKIQHQGLIPALGERSSEAAEAEPRVFLFGSRQDVDDALGNWLGEEFENHDGDLLIIEMDTPLSARPSFPDSDSSWEWSTTEPIPAEALTIVDRC